MSANVVSEDEASLSEYDIDHIEVHAVELVPEVVPPKCLIQAVIDTTPIEFELDTGSAVSVIGYQTWKALGSPSLQETHRAAKAYGGQLLRFRGVLQTEARLIDGFVYDAGQKAIKRIAHFLKQTGKVKVPEWSDLVKLGVTKDMAPPTLTGSTSAPPLGLAACTSALPSQHLPYGSVIHKALKSLEALKWVDKSEDGKGRLQAG
ncbi:hypothetical protein PRIPAC_72999 [Pristionchus pacificus]|uniref:Ribosomal protein n=1 Tax=Pristionchus pacificus TaxID=54126 RepID=A0A2A6C781_PRIPA|nr:hypothetical protein PRIPAC_72999 [Pristionchus pacificus]|eukprot:PDM73881.1 ribosomal protein [Pristionchus pacificus]